METFDRLRSKKKDLMGISSDLEDKYAKDNGNNWKRDEREKLPYL